MTELNSVLREYTHAANYFGPKHTDSTILGQDDANIVPNAAIRA